MNKKHGVSAKFLQKMKELRNSNPQRDDVHVWTREQIKQYNECMRKDNPAYLLDQWRRLTKKSNSLTDFEFN